MLSCGMADSLLKTVAEERPGLTQLLRNLTSGENCLAVWGAVLGELVRYLPVLPGPRTSVDIVACPALLIDVPALPDLPNPNLTHTTNYKSKVFVLTRATPNFTQANETLHKYRRSKFVWISQNDHESHYFTYINSTTLTPIGLAEVYTIFRKKVQTEKLANFGGEKLRIAAVNFSIYSRVSTPDHNGRLSIPFLISFLSQNTSPSNLENQAQVNGWTKGIFLSHLVSICRMLGLEPEVYTLTKVLYDRVYRNGSLKRGGIEHEAKSWAADVAVGRIYFKASMIGEYDFLNPWGLVCNRYLVPRPKKIVLQWTFFTNPFQPHVWALIILADIVLAALSTTFTNTTPDPSVRRGRGLFDWLLDTTTSLVLAHIPWRACGRPTTCLIGSWVCACFVLTTAFSASLSSHLAVPSLQTKVDTIPGFVKAGYTWGRKVTNRYNPINNPFIAQGSTALRRQWSFGRFREQKSWLQREERMATGKYVIPGESLGELFFLHGIPVPSRKRLKDYEAASQCDQQYYLVMLLPYGSRYTMALNRAMSRLQQGGILYARSQKSVMSDSLLRQHVIDNAFTPTRVLLQSGQPLALGSMFTAFFLLIAGLLFATSVFVAELLLHKWVRRSSRRTL